MYIFKNGSIYAADSRSDQPGSAQAATTVQIEMDVPMNVGDYVEIWGQQGSGGSLATVAGRCSMRARWVHA